MGRSIRKKKNENEEEKNTEERCRKLALKQYGERIMINKNGYLS